MVFEDRGRVMELNSAKEIVLAYSAFMLVFCAGLAVVAVFG